MKFVKYIFSLTLLLTALNLCAQQNFNTSNTSVDYEQQSGTLNITTRLYTAAIEKVLNEKTSNKSNFDAKLKSYINNKVDIKINGKPIHLSYYGFQTNEHTTRLYLKVDKINDITSLELKLGLLMDYYDDQQNFIKVDIKNNRKSFVIRKESEVIKINF